MNLKEYITKLQNLPDNKKRAILWSVVGIFAGVMGFFWIMSVRDKLPKIENAVKSVKLPEVKMDLPPVPQTVTTSIADWKT